MDREDGLSHHYCVYGIGVTSDRTLPLPRSDDAPLCRVEIVHGDSATFHLAAGRTPSTGASSWFRCVNLPDRRTYACWRDVGEFLVGADGRRLRCRRFEGSSDESFYVYMLGQALSYAVIKQGLEPLHATAVAIGDAAVAFLGGNGFGKSTLAAAFLDAGFRLLTDDVLVTCERPHAVFAYPGPGRLKLFPLVARRLVPADEGVAMNRASTKLVLPLGADRRCATAVRLRAVYTLAAPRDNARRREIAIERLPPRSGFVELLRSAFDRGRLATPERLTRQFRIVTGLVERVPISRLSYPRSIERLCEVRAAVLEDLAHAPRLGAPLLPLQPATVP
jgi:hypothetical protein